MRLFFHYPHPLATTPPKNIQGIGEHDSFHHSLFLWAVGTAAIPAWQSTPGESVTAREQEQTDSSLWPSRGLWGFSYQNRPGHVKFNSTPETPGDVPANICSMAISGFTFQNSDLCGEGKVPRSTMSISSVMRPVLPWELPVGLEQT